LGLRGGNQGGQLRLSGVGCGLNACHGQCVFRWKWNGCGWRKRRSGYNGCGVSGVVSGIRQTSAYLLLVTWHQTRAFLISVKSEK
jgi:hypothetical protein